jgi:hypothetical protein
MPKYIDLDKLIAHLSRAHKTHLNDGRVEYSCGILLASDIAYNEPKVDVVEVVRCKDCKYWNYEYCTQSKLKKPLETNADDFCSSGKRNESEVEGE